MLHVPADLQNRLRRYGQEHVLAWWHSLNDDERRQLVKQLQRLDLDLLEQLYARRDEKFTVPTPERLAPIPVAHPLPSLPLRVGQSGGEGHSSALLSARRLGEETLRQGKVAALLVAGGQGSRLGFEHPKGMLSIGAVSKKSLFQLHAEKVLALSRRYGQSIPLLVMASPTNHGEIESFFREHRHFGLPRGEVFFFTQGTMPALDLATGKLLLEKPGRLFDSPNGHGGCLSALAETGLLDGLRQRGAQHVFYFQVDNPLVKVADPVFLGQHCAARAEVSIKVIAKSGPHDKLGNLVLLDDRCTIIEYSDLPPDLAEQRDGQGRLRFWIGSPAIHIFDVDFLGRVTQGQAGLPFHLARKKVACLDAEGKEVKPGQENALKFEMFIFDVFPRAERWTVVETGRREEYAPVKNATPPDSPETAGQALSNLAGDWLEKAGVAVPRRPNGDVAVPLEISPLFALDAEALAAKVDRSLEVRGPLYLDDNVTG